MFTVFQIFVVSIAFLLTAQSIIGSIYNLDFFLMSPFFNIAKHTNFFQWLGNKRNEFYVFI